MNILLHKGDLLNIIISLNNLQNEKLSISTKFDIQKINYLLGQEYKSFNEEYSFLLKEHGAIQDGDKLFIEHPTQEALSELNELNNQIVEISIEPIDYNKIKDIETNNNYDLNLLKQLFINL